MFDFLTGKKDESTSASSEAPALGVGAATETPQQSSTGSVSTAAIDEARTRAEQALDLSPRRRRSTRRDATNSAANQRDLQGEVNQVLIKQLDALHAPEAWGALLGAPADIAQALTGRDHWNLSDKERNTLGATGSAAARVMMITNPRALAFAMLGSAVTMVYLPRLIKEARAIRAEKEAKDAAAKKA